MTILKSLSRVSVAVIIAVPLIACQGMQDNPKQTGGTLLGAGLGALVGSQIGSGKGQMAAIAIGAGAAAKSASPWTRPTRPMPNAPPRIAWSTPRSDKLKSGAIRIPAIPAPLRRPGPTKLRTAPVAAILRPPSMSMAKRKPAPAGPVVNRMEPGKSSAEQSWCASGSMP